MWHTAKSVTAVAVRDGYSVDVGDKTEELTRLRRHPKVKLPTGQMVVIARSVGTGNYFSAYAFTFEKNTLSFQTSVEGVSPGANPITALKEKLDHKL